MNEAKQYELYEYEFRQKLKDEAKIAQEIG